MPIVTPTPIAAGPSVPNSNDPETTFDAQFEAFLAWQRNTLAPGVNAQSQAAFDNASASQASATAAQASALASEASAVTSLASSNFRGDWATLTGALNKPASVAHAGRTWLLLSDLADVTAAVPGASASWRAYDVLLPVVSVTTATHTAISGYHYSLEFAGVVSLTMPPYTEGAMVVVTVANNRYDNVLLRNGGSFMDIVDDITLVQPTTYCLRGIKNSWRGL